jgi:hypothetical protein
MNRPPFVVPAGDTSVANLGVGIRIIMGRMQVCNPDVVLDLFARKLSLGEISVLVDGVPIGTLGAIVHRARKRGDQRAAPRRRGGKHAPAPARHPPGVEPQRFRRRRLARAFPSTPAELKAAIAQTSVPVRRFSPGLATWGWRPSWLRV